MFNLAPDAQKVASDVHKRRTGLRETQGDINVAETEISVSG